MKWASVKIESIRDGARHSLVGGPFGSDLTTRDYVDEGVPVIRGVNLPDDRQFNDDEFVFVSEEKADALAANNAVPSDVVFTQRGTLGQVGLIPPDCRFPRYLISQSQMKLTVDAAKANAKFVFYYFRHPTTVQTIKNRAITSGVPHINLGILRDFEIPLPPLPAQNRIVETLSAYDDLIENNRRRRRVLEESARLLYQEWFVRLRFPGHEHVRITNGVPEGWSKSNLEFACIPKHGIQTGPFGSQLHQSDYSDDGTPVVMPKDIIGSRISTESIARVPEEICERLSRHILQTGDIVLARRGDIGRKAFVTERETGWMCGTGCMRLRPDSTVVSPRYLLHTLGRPDVMGIIAGRAQGAIMPNLNLSILTDVPLVLPPATLQREFDELVATVEHQLTNLGEQSTKLCTARDLLLPRLMSGEITV
jgi:type I restriction enzyme S subunit